MSDAFTDANEGLNPWDSRSSDARDVCKPLDERINTAKAQYFHSLQEYLELAKKTHNKRKLAPVEKIVIDSAAKWENLCGVTKLKGLSKTLKSLVNEDQSAWGRLLCSIDSQVTFDEFAGLSPFSNEGINIVQCNGDSIRLLKGELKVLLDQVLPTKREPMSRYLAVTSGIGHLQVVVFSGE